MIQHILVAMNSISLMDTLCPMMQESYQYDMIIKKIRLIFFENILIEKFLQLMARVVKQQFVKVTLTVKHLSMIVQ